MPAASASGDKCVGGSSGGVDAWEAMLSDHAASPGEEQTFLRWVMGDIDDSDSATPHHQMFSPQVQPGFDSSFSFFGDGLADACPGFQGAAAPSVSSPVLSRQVLNSLPTFFQEPVEEEKPHLYNPGLVLLKNQQQPQQNPTFFLTLPPQPPQNDHHMIIPPLLKRHNPVPMPSEVSLKVVPFPPVLQNQTQPVNPMYQLQQRRPAGKPKDEADADAAAQQQHQGLVDQLFQAAELVENSNTLSAREILARLNHQLPASQLGMNPLLRSTFYFKEALHVLCNSTTAPVLAPLSSPWDVVLKLSTYKAFSDVSPLLHFANFTSTQILLEELGSADRIHIVDFDIGVGGHWSSFMQELAHCRSTTAIPLLKITAFVSASSFHPLELHLIRQNLSHFADELNVPFDLDILSIESSFDQSQLLAVSPTEAIGVNLPVGCHYNVPFPTLLRSVKKLCPKVVVSVERGCDRSDLSFTHSFLHSFQSCMVLLDSIGAAGASSDVAGKIERFMVQPWVEGVVMGRHRATEQMHPWQTLFSSVGFVPVHFSNFTETQAECLLERIQVKGFHVEKRQASLILYWQRGELGSVSAWR